MGGLHIIQSNRMEALVDALLERIGAQHADPFERLTLIVPQPALATWLELELSERQGVCMGVEFLLPARALASLLPQTPDHRTEDALHWTLFEQLLRDPAAGLTEALIEPRRELKAMRFAQEFARLFDEYLLYRGSECTHTLAFAEPADPQNLLWSKIAAQIRPHRGERLAQFMASLKSRPNSMGHIRWHWFVSSALPQAHVQALQALSAAGATITLYALSPSQDYFRDLIAKRRGEPAALGVPMLLSHSGGRFADLTEQLLELDPTEIDDRYASPPSDTELHRLQRRLLDLGAEPSHVESGKDDASIRIALAASEIDELSALKIDLLARMRADPTLEPRDILVLTPEIDRYAPLIEGVFGPRFGNDPLQLPYGLSDRQRDREMPMARHFLKFLALDPGAVEITVLDELLLLPEWRARLELSDADAGELLDLLREAQFRFGLDAESRARSGLGDFAEHSLAFVCDRLLLGLATPAGSLWQGIAALPSGGIEQAGSIASLVAIMQDLESIKRLRTAHLSADVWETELGALLEQLYPEPAEQRSQISDLLRSELANARAALGERAFALDSLRIALESALASQGNASGFLGGGITFSALVPLRAVPARVVCVVGLNAETFPRLKSGDALNLLRRAPRRGERDVRADDRHLFLETVLSARDALYLSAVALAPHDLSLRPLSPLLNELMIDLAPDASARANLPDYIQSGLKLAWPQAPAASTARKAASPPAGSTIVSLRQLERALKNLPKRYWRSRVRLSEADSTDPDAMRIDADWRDPWRLKQALLQEPALTLKTANARGLLNLPSDSAELERARASVKQLLSMRPTREETRSVLLKLDSFRLLGQLKVESEDAQTVLLSGSKNAAQMLSAWVKHLALAALNATPETVTTHVHWMEKELLKSLTISGVIDPLTPLRDLLSLYQASETELLAFYPAASLAWLQSEGDAAAVHRTIQSDNFRRGLLEDPFFALTHSLRAAQLPADAKCYAQRVFKPMLSAVS